MADEITNTINYTEVLSAALKTRAEWLEQTELGKLKDELRNFQTGFTSLYNMYLKKGLIKEDPYKQEAKIGELEVPDSSAFTDAERIDKLSIRLANYDNQLDFLVNFYQFNLEFLNLDRIKRIAALVRYIDWVNLSPDSQQSNTKGVAEINNQLRAGLESMGLRVAGESQNRLSRGTPLIMGYLKELSDYHREAYKLNLREKVTSLLSPEEASQIAQVRKKFGQVLPGQPFYAELAEEVIKEDYSKDGPALREKALKDLHVAETKPKAAKAQVSFKTPLLEGLQCLGSTAALLNDIHGKIEENQKIMESRKLGLWEKIMQIIAQVMNKEPEAVIYNIEYLDPNKDILVKDKVNFFNFSNDLDRRAKILAAYAPRNITMSKLNAMPEEQLLQLLERGIREVQYFHKILGGLDDYFKTNVERESRERIRGIKPELAAIKNALIRSNQKRYEYSARMEEEEQLKNLGVKPAS